ncbi:MAG: alpha/beta hydrolase [Muribaculaceae bacterium]|nr:alpha/beta hydrolase [Muribaculaceae bacterium]
MRRGFMAIMGLMMACVQARGYRLTPFPADGPDSTAVIVCPGGSYFWLDRQTEGYDVARRLQEAGISAFVLEYRVAGVPEFISHSRLLRRGVRYPDMLDDLQRAILEVRADADRYGIRTDRVGVMGFSAGGHLVALAGQQFDRCPGARPDFVASIYPVVTFTDECTHRRSRRGIIGDRPDRYAGLLDTLSLERHVRPNMPPVFLMNCMDDPVVDPRNAVLLDSALTAGGVDHTYIQYATGGHGFGATAAKTSPEAAGWFDAFVKWLAERFKDDSGR